MTAGDEQLLYTREYRGFRYYLVGKVYLGVGIKHGRGLRQAPRTPLVDNGPVTPWGGAQGADIDLTNKDPILSDDWVDKFASQSDRSL